ncbi:uncharacterized protein CANTADRAFT_25602 [Suhomyces tanzawaensis NRRL Y-17324]|uniref:Uncharacterized protein n=1 Tax=Suhomyces tanzawaensis NRRL Y-17324 TaxID=984487 RepID=A0A1E4SJM2_9ASCO|nr:uncharacterized protein CANTADRAFT_25602 [Suhomyces tanzawaensis NRRL Y-17324]ODV79715.1 hypothetical protein CANTADRAFT_25602 [Suhomyces tanzawaensis NRRL Y-17324]
MFLSKTHTDTRKWTINYFANSHFVLLQLQKPFLQLCIQKTAMEICRQTTTQPRRYWRATSPLTSFP